MDYLDNLLIEPLEEETKYCDNLTDTEKKQIATSPDIYRPYLFNLSCPHTEDLEAYNYLQLASDTSQSTDDTLQSTFLVKLATLTKTSISLWKLPTEKIITKIIKKLAAYKSLPKHYPPKFIIKQHEYPIEIQIFYKEIYDMLDILVIRAKNDHKKLIPLMKKLLNIASSKMYIVYRTIYYVVFYFTELSYGKYKQFIDIISAKIQEFVNEPNIKHYFLMEELTAYNNKITNYKQMNS